jgi:hypothetical protein
MKEVTGTTRIAAYPYTATSCPIEMEPSAAIRAASQVTPARNTDGSPTARPLIQLVTPATR